MWISHHLDLISPTTVVQVTQLLIWHEGHSLSPCPQENIREVPHTRNTDFLHETYCNSCSYCVSGPSNDKNTTPDGDLVWCSKTLPLSFAVPPDVPCKWLTLLASVPSDNNSNLGQPTTCPSPTSLPPRSRLTNHTPSSQIHHNRYGRELQITEWERTKVRYELMGANFTPEFPFYH